MLNRTNRTNSANLNRLNLGTRSLALQGVVNGKNTLRARHAHGFAMRDGMFGSSDPSTRPSASGIGITSVPGSTPVEPWPVEGPVVRPPVGVLVTPVVPGVRRLCASGLPGTGQAQPQSGLFQRPVKPLRDALTSKRTDQGYASGADRADAAWTTAAATVAAAGG